MPEVTNPPVNSSATPEEAYPAIERFVESATDGDITELFAPLRAALDELKGPRKHSASSVVRAIELVEGVLRNLIEVRDKMAPPR